MGLDNILGYKIPNFVASRNCIDDGNPTTFYSNFPVLIHQYLCPSILQGYISFEVHPSTLSYVPAMSQSSSFLPPISPDHLVS